MVSGGWWRSSRPRENLSLRRYSGERPKSSWNLRHGRFVRASCFVGRQNGSQVQASEEVVTMAGATLIDTVVSLVEPILADLGLELYDCDFAGGTLKVTVDTPTGQDKGVDLEQLALVTRLLGRELDHGDVVTQRYTLEVTSPGLERTLRTPAHFRREIGKDVNVRLRTDIDGRRRLNGTLVAATDSTATVRLLDDAVNGPVDVTVSIADIEKARTVFVWAPTPKPGSPASRTAKSKRAARGGSSHPNASVQPAEVSAV